MKVLTLKNLLALSLCILVVTLLAVGTASAQSSSSGNPKTSLRPVQLIATGAIVPSAGSTLLRNKDGVYFDLHTSSLMPGVAASAWLAVFNNPEFCAETICTPNDFANPLVDGTLFSTGGVVVGRDGKAVYGAYRAVGDLTGARPGVGFGAGLKHPLTAQIHIVVRTHGMASEDPAILEQQLTMFNGNCPGGVGCVSLQTSIHER